MPQSLPHPLSATPDTIPATVPAAAETPFLLRNPGRDGEPIVTAAPRATRVDPFEVRLSGKLLRAQLRGTLPARHR